MEPSLHLAILRSEQSRNDIAPRIQMASPLGSKNTPSSAKRRGCLRYFYAGKYFRSLRSSKVDMLLSFSVSHRGPVRNAILLHS